MRFGVKLYELTTSDGITLAFLVYCGKGMLADDEINQDMPLTKRIHSVLMEKFIGKSMSSTLTTITQVQPLQNTFYPTTHIYGTIRSNQYNFPKDVINKVLEPGDAVFYYNKDSPLVACKYLAHRDKASGQQKVVHMLSICHQPSTELGNNEDNVKKLI